MWKQLTIDEIQSLREQVDIFVNADIISLTDPITLTSPNTGAKWQAGSTQIIKWTSTGSCGQSLIISLWKGGTYVSNIATTTDTGSYSWTIPNTLTPATNYSIKIEKSGDSSCNNQNTRYNFEITAPGSGGGGGNFITSPTAGINWVKGSTYNITWNTTNISGNVEIHLFKGNQNTWIMTINQIGNTGSYAWKVPSTLTAGNDYIIKIEQVSNTNVNGFSSLFTISDTSVGCGNPSVNSTLS